MQNGWARLRYMIISEFYNDCSIDLFIVAWMSRIPVYSNVHGVAEKWREGMRQEKVLVWSTANGGGFNVSVTTSDLLFGETRWTCLVCLAPKYFSSMASLLGLRGSKMFGIGRVKKERPKSNLLKDWIWNSDEIWALRDRHFHVKRQENTSSPISSSRVILGAAVDIRNSRGTRVIVLRPSCNKMTSTGYLLPEDELSHRRPLAASPNTPDSIEVMAKPNTTNNSLTLTWDELPDWRRDNEYIMGGYRR